MTPTRPKPFSETERGRIDRIKRIKAAEEQEKARMESQAMWQESRDEMWIAEAFEVRDHIRQQQEKQRLQNEVAMAVIVTESEIYD